MAYYTSTNLATLGMAMALSIEEEANDESKSGLKIDDTGKKVECSNPETLSQLLQKSLIDGNYCQEDASSDAKYFYPQSLDDLTLSIATQICAELKKNEACCIGLCVELGKITCDSKDLALSIIGLLENECKSVCSKDEIPGAEVPSSGVPNDIRESVAIANVKTLAEQPAMLSNLSFSDLITNDNLSQQNAVSFQQSINQMTLTVTGNGVNRVSDLKPLEAISVTEVLTSNDLTKDILELRAVTVTV